jgi:hypothetical protein
MPSYHLHIANDAEQIYTGKHLQLIVAQGASTETAHCITKQENYHKAYQKHKQTNLYVTLDPNKHCSNKQATTQYDSPVSVEVPQLMGSLTIYIIHTPYVAQC